MNKRYVACPMCGYVFDPKEHTGCRSCPLEDGCATVCCPACGYQTIDVGRSHLVRLAANFVGWATRDRDDDRSS